MIDMIDMIIGLVVRVKVAVKEVKAPVVGNQEGIALPIDTAIEGVAVTIEGVVAIIEGVAVTIEGVAVTIEGVTAVIEGIAEVLLVAVAVAKAKAVAVAEVMV
jgi:hypothetical protein